MIDLKGSPFYLSDEDIKWVTETQSGMSVEEKIGQLFCPIGYSSDENYLKHEILSNQVGGMMFKDSNIDEMYRMNDFLQSHSKIPLFLTGNLESGGNGALAEGTFFGKQLQVAATDESKYAYKLGLISCREGAAVGLNYTFAPVVDIDYNYHNPITNVRTFGDNIDKIIEYSKQYLKAAKETGVATSIKHFPGDGVDERDQHIVTSINSLGTDEWDRSYGKIYQELIEAGALTVMAGHIGLPAYQKQLNPNCEDETIPASLSKELLQGLLRDKLGFNGMIISDATPMVGFCAAMDRETAVPTAIQNGCDVFLFNKDLAEDIEFMKKGYEKGILTNERLDEAVLRILATKAALKLHIKQREGRLVPEKEAHHIIGCKKHQEWARECADKGITLVKDSQKLLPLDREKHKRVLLQILGDFPSNERVFQRIKENLENESFQVTRYAKESFSFDGKMEIDNITQIKRKYDLVLYIGNVENASNQTTNRINWYTLFGLGNNIPWFVKEVPTMFISLANPYHLLDVPMIKTYINCYSNNDYVIDAVTEKVLGKSTFKGINPVDPFCKNEYLKN